MCHGMVMNASYIPHDYMLKAMEHLESFILECDRKTELAKRRLKETQEELSEEAAAKVRGLCILYLYSI